MEVREPSVAVVPASPVKNEPFMTRRFTSVHTSVFTQFVWCKRSSEIKDDAGAVIMRRDDLEFPEGWSQNAVDIVTAKYFRMVEQSNGTVLREHSLRQMVLRVADTLTKWGREFGHLRNPDDAATFHAELSYILTNQMAAFNSPVWFNIGTKRGRLREEQASACFINSVEDNMDSIEELGKIEGKLYKGGSGSGVNYSPLRSSREGLSGGGTASGPVPFVQKDDANAGAIKSGGTTRRAAKMVILNVDHGDILEFINCKARAEKMAHALIDAGFDGDFRARGGAYQSVPFQNANHSVRVTDEFMHAVEADAEWKLFARDGVTVLEVVKARDLWDAICEAAWVCGDPGLQFDTQINRWHTCPEDGRINASNPCSEYMHLDNSACNLASLNLRKFQNQDGTLRIDEVNHTVDVMITAMDIIIDGAAYPTKAIETNAHHFRQLGLGYANLGAFLMAAGLPYDSDDGRFYAGMITSLLSGRAYRRSAVLAKHVGAFSHYQKNEKAMKEVLQMHHAATIDSSDGRPYTSPEGYVYGAAVRAWKDAIALCEQYGVRNSQATVLAPTGTIGFMMDCDTTGIEPDIALVKKKKLVGGGTMEIVNQSVEAALQKLGYDQAVIPDICKYMSANGSAVGSGVRDEHLAVFDTSYEEKIGRRCLSTEAHVRMMGATQGFISGAISKTVNMPENTTTTDISRAYLLGWKLGLKAIAIYREGCKRSQPLENAKAAANAPSQRETELQAMIVDLEAKIAQLRSDSQLHRKKLPDDCKSDRHKFKIGDHKGYLHMGMYPDGTLGEIFIKMNKEGSTVSGLMDTIATLTSMAIQYGVPLKALCDKFKYTSFEPAGWTPNHKIGRASSIVDYIFRCLEESFLNSKEIPVIDLEAPGLTSGRTSVKDVILANAPRTDTPRVNGHADGNTCPDCGHTLQRTGSCRSCVNCGFNSGCG